MRRLQTYTFPKVYRDESVESGIAMAEKSTWEKIVDAIAKNSALFLVVLGIALGVVGANGGFQAWLNIKDYWRVFLAVMGVLVAAFGVRLIWRGGGDVDTSSIAKDCDLKITLPKSNSEVDEKIEMEGTYRKKPPRRSVVVVIERTPSGRHWFKGSFLFNEREKHWSATVHIGGRKEKRTLYVAILGEAGEVLRGYFMDVQERFNQSVGVQALTPDIAICDEVEVNYRGEAKAAAAPQST